MTGGAVPLHPAELLLSSESKTAFGTPRILGPKWAHFPILTIGFLGIQILWSVEMAYGLRPRTSPTHTSFDSSRTSISIPAFARGLTIQYGNRLLGGASLRTNRPTVDRGAGGQLDVALGP
jgi:hypothetical protein